MPPEYNQEEWAKLLEMIESRSIDREMLISLNKSHIEFREEWLVVNATMGEKFNSLIRDIRSIRGDYSRLSSDMDQVVSNHQSEWRRVAKDLTDADMERHDFRAAMEKYMAENYISRRDARLLVSAVSIVATACILGTVWFFTNVQTKNYKASVAAQIKQQNETSLEQMRSFKRDMSDILREFKQ